jgi:predicted anti-sigma-YlaC factor YlaD
MNPENADRDLHQRARRLIDRQQIEGLAAGERRWLEAHLADCEVCADWGEAAESALRMFRSASVAPPPGLAASASLRVRQRAGELEQQRARNLALIVGCTLSWLLGVASAPFVYELCAWLGSRLDLARIVWQTAFFVWWFVPAGAASLVIILARARSQTGLNTLDSELRWRR